jgi:hypothetical protein
MNADGSGLRPFTADRHMVRYPAPCGPGPLFAFAGGASKSGALELYVGDPDGAAPRELAEGKPRSSCAPDGQWLIYSNDKNEIRKVPIGGGQDGQAVRLFENARIAIPSKNGQWMALIQMDPKGAPDKLAVKSMIGRADANLADLGATVIDYKWNPDGAGLTVVMRGAGADNLWNLPLGGSPANQITHFTSETIRGFAWNGDGRLAVARGHNTDDAVLIQRK